MILNCALLSVHSALYIFILIIYRKMEHPNIAVSKTPALAMVTTGRRNSCLSTSQTGKALCIIVTYFFKLTNVIKEYWKTYCKCANDHSGFNFPIFSVRDSSAKFKALQPVYFSTRQTSVICYLKPSEP